MAINYNVIGARVLFREHGRDLVIASADPTFTHRNIEGTRQSMFEVVIQCDTWLSIKRNLDDEHVFDDLGYLGSNRRWSLKLVPLVSPIMEEGFIIMIVEDSIYGYGAKLYKLNIINSKI